MFFEKKKVFDENLALVLNFYPKTYMFLKKNDLR